MERWLHCLLQDQLRDSSAISTVATCTDTVHYLTNFIGPVHHDILCHHAICHPSAVDAVAVPQGFQQGHAISRNVSYPAQLAQMAGNGSGFKSPSTRSRRARSTALYSGEVCRQAKQVMIMVVSKALPRHGHHTHPLFR